jgi:hypothetical protein
VDRLDSDTREVIGGRDAEPRLVLAGVANVVVVTGPPSLNAPNGPLSARSHAWAVMGLVRSVEVDTSEMDSPGRGKAGNHTNEASG